MFSYHDIEPPGVRLFLASSSAPAPTVGLPSDGNAWVMPFRSIDYLVVFYYQTIMTKKGPSFPPLSTLFPC